MSNLRTNREMLFKIVAIFPLKNQIELLCTETSRTFYFKFFPHQSAQSQLKSGDFFLVKGSKFQVLKKNKNKVQGLSGSLDKSRQLLLFNEM